MKRTDIEVTAHVQTALTLNEKEKREVAEFLKSTGFTGSITYSVEDEVLGGIRIEVGDWVYDTTLKERLQKLVTTLA